MNITKEIIRKQKYVLKNKEKVTVELEEEKSFLTLNRKYTFFIYTSGKQRKAKLYKSHILVTDTETKSMNIYECVIKNNKVVKNEHIQDLNTFIEMANLTADEIILLKTLINQEKTKFKIIKKDMDYILKKLKVK